MQKLTFTKTSFAYRNMKIQKWAYLGNETTFWVNFFSRGHFSSSTIQSHQQFTKKAKKSPLIKSVDYADFILRPSFSCSNDSIWILAGAELFFCDPLFQRNTFFGAWGQKTHQKWQTKVFFKRLKGKNVIHSIFTFIYDVTMTAFYQAWCLNFLYHSAV